MESRFVKPYRFSLVWLILMVITGFLLPMVGCSDDAQDSVDQQSETEIEDSDQLATSTTFALYREEPVTITPSLDQPPIAPDLSNVHIPVPLSSAQRARLVLDGLVASPGLQEKEFFTLYEKARYDNIPIFITSDSLLHAYHLMFSKTLRTAEAEYFHPLLKDLNLALVTELEKQHRELSGGPWEDAALRTLAFVTVAGKLADPQFTVVAPAAELVSAELANIEAAAGMQSSPIFNELLMGEDYSQYIPRGHYTKSEELKSYFKSMMWYGRMTFRLASENETRSALLLLRALRNTQVNGLPALEVWTDLYNPTAFLVGRSDDLTAFDYLPLVDEIYGTNPALDVLADEEQLPDFLAAARKLPPPKILGLAIVEADQLADTAGLRFMGQRFVPDAYIFSQLTFDSVSDFENRRGLPVGLDLFAALGSDRAYTILDEMGETDYSGYPEQMEKMRLWTGSLTVNEWTETVNNAWLYAFQPLIEVPGEDYPQFMQSTAWLDKQLHTSLGSWAELKHDTILYAKQSYAELGGGWMPTPPDPLPARGYVEPVPRFFARLAALAAMTGEGLGDRGLLSEQDASSLRWIEELSLALKLMAEKQLQGIPLSEEEHQRIRFYGGELEQLVMAAADPADGEDPGLAYMDEDPQAALIADVATDLSYSGEDFSGLAVLEVGVGRVNELLVVVPLVEEDGSLRLQVAKGGIFSYYEFPWPGTDRLTDEKWQAMLDDGSAPPPPAWIESFYTTDGGDQELQSAIYIFQKGWVNALFYLDESYAWARGAALFTISMEIDALDKAKQSEGRQLLEADYRSFDRQSADRAVVTVRETWQDKLYSFADTTHPSEMDENTELVEVGQRGPYTIDITYTLERDPDAGWVVTRIVPAGDRPAW